MEYVIIVHLKEKPTIFMNAYLKTLAFIIFHCSISFYAHSQSSAGTGSAKLKLSIETANKKIATLYQTKNADDLVQLYEDDLTFFPEYKKAIFDPVGLKKFYASWFNGSNVTSYQKTIVEVQAIKEYALEIGRFHLVHTGQKADSSASYKGNYMVLWKTNGDGSLRIVSEAFGSDHTIELKDLPYRHVTVEETIAAQKNQVSKKLQDEIEEFNAVVIKAVAEGDAKSRAAGFTSDGVLIPAFDSFKTGMKAISEHMYKTYRPGTSFVVKHDYFRIYDWGNYVFINAHYSGGWGDSNNGGHFEGNMSNMMKRDKNGKLLMYRQLGNRDSELMIFDNSKK